MTMPSMHQFTFTFFALLPHCINGDWPVFDNKIQSSESERIEVKLLPFTLTANIHVHICVLYMKYRKKHLRKHTRAVVALSVECRTCDQEVVGSTLGRARGVKTLGMFLTPMPLFITRYKLVLAKGR